LPAVSSPNPPPKPIQPVGRQRNHRGGGCRAGKRKKRHKSKLASGVCLSRRAMMLAEDPHCKYCGKELTMQTATIDHVIPRCKGGTNAKENLVLACFKCNNDKDDKLLDEWDGPHDGQGSSPKSIMPG
jgi:5-methylcytosine-specific restriction endonuclease McrA